jgi:hypothetical protein
MSLRFAKLAALFTLAHGIVLGTCFTIAFNSAVYRFDHRVEVAGHVEQACSMLTRILIQPFERLFGAGPNPINVNLTAVFLSSLVWGVALAMIYMLNILKWPRATTVRDQ